jgi:hypothetical protein
VTPAAGQVGQVKSQSAVCQATVCAHQRESGVGGVRCAGRGCDRKTKARAFQVVIQCRQWTGQVVEVPEAPAQSSFALQYCAYPSYGCLWHNQCMLPCQVGRGPLQKRGERGERRETKGDWPEKRSR